MSAATAVEMGVPICKKAGGNISSSGAVGSVESAIDGNISFSSCGYKLRRVFRLGQHCLPCFFKV